jgi:hypothetical protein
MLLFRPLVVAVVSHVPSLLPFPFLPPNPAGGGKKKEPEKPLSVVLQEFEASLDANVRKPLYVVGCFSPF